MKLTRIATRAGAVALVALATLVPLAGSAATAAPAAPATSTGRVVIVSIPRLTWPQVSRSDLPNLKRFLAQSAVGDLSLRTIGPRTSLGEGYITMGAGNRAGVRDADAGRMLSASDLYENGTAADAYHRRTGWKPRGQLLQLSIAAINATNDRYLYGADPGAMGTALDRAKFRTSVIGNDDVELSAAGLVTFDPSSPTGEPSDGPADETGLGNNPDPAITGTIEPLNGENRPAGLAVMDGQGQVPQGSVSRNLLTRDKDAAFGIALSEREVLAAFDSTWGDRAVSLVELSDLERADLYRSRAAAAQASILFDRALTRTDHLLGELLKRTKPGDLVVVVSPASPRAHETLTPIAIRGPGFSSGTLSSGTTRRAGYVTLPDIAPTILEHLGVTKPESMTGSAIAATNDGSTSTARIDSFIQKNEATKFRDAAVMTITILFVVMQVVLCGLALAALIRGTTWLRRSAALLGLVTMCLPVITFALGLGRLYRIGFWPYLLLMYVGAGLLAYVSVWFGRRTDDHRRAVLTTLIPVALTYVVLVVDILTGGHLQLNTIFGYSPLVAGRFSGYGNPAYSLLSMGTIILACGLWAYFDGDRPGPARRRLLVGIIAMFCLTIVVDGHPSLGSDVGGVLSIIPTAFLVVWLLLGRRIRARVVLLAGAATLLVISLFAIIDLQRPETKQTHLGRLVRSTFGNGGGDGLTTTIERKINANITVLTHSIWTWTIPLALIVLARISWRRPRMIDSHLPNTPATRAALWGGICMCVLGMAVNDSGIAIPAVMFMLFLPYILYQVLTPAEYVAPPADGADDGPGPVPDPEPEPALVGADT
ncbi:hypothetical protein [Aquihabitans sp. McL0605]|uniref:hypothetical protein n=1 Tax=Aquihabitans sp. McL0605 TaxID=3415671 RepID=UPI003CE7CE8B